MAQEILADDLARQRILEGARKVYEPVRNSMGPLGRNTIIDNQMGLPVPTHDGVAIARSIRSLPEDETNLGVNAGLRTMKLAAEKLDEVGDGTTTVTVLAYHLLFEANKLISAGHNPMVLKRQLDAAFDRIMKGLPKYVEKLTTKERLEQIATISVGGNETLGKLIAEVMHKVGEDGSATVEQSQGSKVTYDMVDGFKFDRGIVSRYMVTDKTKMKAVVDAAPILITDARISNITDLIPILEKVAEQKIKKIVIICEDMDGDALQTLVLNKMKGSFLTVAIKAPAFGDRRKAILEDIAILTGGLVVSKEQGMELTDTTLEMLGSARQVVADRDSTIILEGQGDPEAIKERISSLKQQAEVADSEFNKEKLEERVAAMAGKVAVIKVGGLTETEVEEKKFRVDDAVLATKAAMAEGIVAGGGVTLLNLVDEYTKQATGEPGEKLLLDALQAPFIQLMDNSGHEGKSLRTEIAKAKKPGWGFSVYDVERMVDLKEAGIIDPARVTRECVENAVSIAGTTMTMGSLVVDIPEQPRNPLPR